MALNDQALLAEWSRQRLGEEFDEFQHRIGDPPEHICAEFERVANADAAAAAADSCQWQSGASGRVANTDAAAAADRCRVTSSSPNKASDSDPDEVQVVTLWDKEARKEDIYKIAYCIFTGRKFGSPSVIAMREWLEIFLTEPPQDFFLNGSKQIHNFNLLMKACRMPTLSKTSHLKKWTTDFLADKLAILLVLCWQVFDEREERKLSGSVGHYAQPRTKLRRNFTAFHKKYVECEQQYAENQCIVMNCRMETPSLNYQMKGCCLQDLFLWDPTKRDLTLCPVCPHGCTMTVETMQALHAYNQGGRDAAGPNGSFTAKSPKIGCFCYMVTCGGRPDGGNCPECIRLSKNGTRTPSPLAGPGECGFFCGVCACRCQVIFEEAHRVEISDAIKLQSDKKQKRGGGEAKKKPEEKGLTVISRSHPREPDAEWTLGDGDYAVCKDKLRIGPN